MGKEATFGRLGNSPAVECLSYSSGDQRSNSLNRRGGGGGEELLHKLRGASTESTLNMILPVNQLLAT